MLKLHRLWPMHKSFDQWGHSETYGRLPSGDPRSIPVRNICTGEVRVMLGADLAERERDPGSSGWRGILLDHWWLRFMPGPWQLIRVAKNSPLSEIFPEPGDYIEVRNGDERRLFKAEGPGTPLCDRRWFVHVDEGGSVSFWERILPGRRHQPPTPQPAASG